MSRSNNKLVPYKLLALLLYGQHNWLDRHGPKVSVPVATLAKFMRTRANRLQEYLDFLETHGFISYRWYKHYATISIVTPPGMAYTLQPVGYVDADPEIAKNSEAIKQELARLNKKMVDNIEEHGEVTLNVE